jgi:hypothetical protein
MPWSNMDDNAIENAMLDKAEADGDYAIAYALLLLGKATSGVQAALYRLGNADAATPMGGLEALGAQIEKAAEIIADAMP